MSDKDIRNQLEGLFSDVVPEPERGANDKSSSAEAIVGPAEAKTDRAETVKGEPVTSDFSPPTSAKHEAEAALLRRHFTPRDAEPRIKVLNSITTRLIIAVLLVAIMPLTVVGGWSLYTLHRASALATEQSEAAVAELAEAAIADTAKATARHLELYLDMHPEVDLTDIAQLESNAELAEIAVQPVGQTGYTAVFDERAMTHFHVNPAIVGTDMSTLADKLPEFWAIFDASLDGSPADGYYGWEDADGQIRAKYMSIVPVEDTALRVAATTYIDEFSQPVTEIRSQLASIQKSARIQMLLIILGVVPVVSAVAFVYSRRLGRPIRDMAQAATRIAAGDVSPIRVQERGDEIGVLATAFNSMTAQLGQTLEGLEGSVAERTRALEVAAEVGQRLSTVRDLDRLLAESVELIQASFDLYHTQIYLTDPAGRHLTLRAGAGEVGAELVRRGHSLPIGPGSINGAAAAQKQAVIVADTAQSAAFLPNPALPDTRSEMAVPLLVSEQVVGVLDLQSELAGSLTVDNLSTFEALAGQLGVAIDNAHLLAEAAQARAEVEAQARRLAGAGWEEFLDGVERGERIGYAYEGEGLELIAEPLVTTPAEHVLAAPIQVQSAPVGAIHVEGEAGRTWTEAEAELVESVARQVAQQAENLRLLAQAEQYRAEAEQASRRLTREGWRAYLEAQDSPGSGFVYDLFQVKPLTDGGNGTGEPPLTRPLAVQGETIGQLAVDEVAALDDEATQLMTAVAEQLSAHIENLRLLEETEKGRYELEERGQELQASQRVTFAASETSDPDELLDLVVNLIRDQFDLYHAQVYLVDTLPASPPHTGGTEEGQAAVLRKSTGYAGRQLLEQGHHIPLEQESLVTRAIRGGEPLVVNDVSQDDTWMPNPLLPHTQSELVVPLKVGGDVIGALDVQSRTPGRFTPDTVALFQTMAEQVAMNFGSSDLLTRTTEQAEALARYTSQLRTAAEVAERLGAILDPDQLLGEVVDLLQSRFGLYHAHIYLVDAPPNGGEAGGAQLVVHAGSGEVGKVLVERDHRIPLDTEKSLVARAARERETVLVEDTSLVSDFMPNPLLPETRSEVALPLVAGDQVLGVLDVQDNQPSRFTPAELDTFTTLAGQIATALQNASLFEEIQQTAEQLREVDRLKSEFLANMSHELRTPLNSILGYTEVMLMGINGELDPETEEDVQAIYDNGQHLLRLISDILDLAKIEAGRLTLNLEEVEIAPLLDEVKTKNAGLLVNQPVEMNLEVEGGLPSIQADRMRLNQILSNLVANSAKFTEEGHITLRASANDGWVCLEVEDSGIGIKEADLEAIFEQFSQADGSFKRRAEGTGLGLAITRHLVHMHAGTIAVRSQEGEGSTFTVRLPVERHVAEAIAVSGNGKETGV